VDLLNLVQTLHYEAKLPGSPPDAVTGQVGRSADLVRWTIEAWNDIQRDQDGRWKWLRSDWTLDTVASTASYAPAAVTDVDDAAVISRFKAWDMDEEEQPFIYLVSEGKLTERELVIYPWMEFRGVYVRGVNTPAYPGVISVKPDDTLYVGPPPDGVYRITGTYWKGLQQMAVDDDIPEMPSDYHMLIVYRALFKYAYNVVGQEILAWANTEGETLLDALVLNQWYGRHRMRWAKALA